jgi:hypothetical protein
VIHIASNRGYRGKLGQRLDNARSADIPRVQDVIRTS